MTDFKNGQTEYFSEDFIARDLSHREIVSTIFDACTFKTCNLNETRFNTCIFRDCHFEKCNLSVVKVRGSQFTNVVFDGCKLIGIDWTPASWTSCFLGPPLKFYNCMMHDSSFFGLKMEGMTLKHCQAQAVDFRGASFKKADFTQTDFLNSMFNQTDLRGADFTEATNYTIPIDLNQIKNAKFSRYEALRLLETLDIELVD